MTGKGKPQQGETETNYEVRSFDIAMPIEEYRTLPKHPIYVVLDNLRSAFNVGSIFRTCDILRVSELLLCGCTAFPPNRKLEKTSLGTIAYVPWRHFAHTLDAIDYLEEQGVEVWAAETTSISRPYHEVEYPGKVGIVFGNEAIGVDREILNKCKTVVQIPTYGFKNSLNVASACAVIGYKALESVERRNGKCG